MFAKEFVFPDTDQEGLPDKTSLTVHRHRLTHVYQNRPPTKSPQKINFRTTNHVTIHPCTKIFAKTKAMKTKLRGAPVLSIRYQDPATISEETL